MSISSYSKHTERHVFIYDTIASRTRQWATDQPNKVALVVHMLDGKRNCITFLELLQKSEVLAKYFLSIGVQKGDRIALFVYNSTEWLVAATACCLVGAVSFNSFTFGLENDFDVVRNLKCKVLILDLRDTQLLQSLEIRLKGLEDTALNVVVLGEKIGRHSKTFEDVLSMDFKDGTNPPKYFDPEATSVIFQTSGSTGVSKLVPFTDNGLLNNLCGLYSSMNIDGRDIFFSDRPMGYMAGFPMPIFILGCTFVTLDTRSAVRNIRADLICNILKTESVTTGVVAPYFIHDLETFQKSCGGKESKYIFKSLIIAGQRFSKGFLGRFRDHVSMPCLGYGSTEVGWVTFSSFKDLPDIEDDLLGAPLPWVEVKVIDEHGHVVPLNTNGEICIRNVITAKSYLPLGGEPKRVTDDDGWFHTGDVGFLLGDRNTLGIKGRSVEIIKRSLIKIFPASIENVILKHPSVAEVVVAGVPDDRMYQEVCACVTVKDGRQLSAAELKSFAYDQFQPELAPDGKGHMPGYFLIFEKFPRLPTQKVDRRGVAKLAVSIVTN